MRITKMKLTPINIILVILAFAAGVYLAALSVHIHHVPWLAVVVTLVILMGLFVAFYNKGSKKVS